MMHDAARPDCLRLDLPACILPVGLCSRVWTCCRWPGGRVYGHLVRCRAGSSVPCVLYRWGEGLFRLGSTVSRGHVCSSSPDPPIARVRRCVPRGWRTLQRWTWAYQLCCVATHLVG